METTNRTKLPIFERSKKSHLLDYELFDEMPVTNPHDISEKLEKEFIKSSYNHPLERHDATK